MPRVLIAATQTMMPGSSCRAVAATEVSEFLLRGLHFQQNGLPSTMALASGYCKLFTHVVTISYYCNRKCLQKSVFRVVGDVRLI
jgi:hypothetical protein